MFRIENDKAVFIFTLQELWWLYHQLPPDSPTALEIWEAIQELEANELKKDEGPGLATVVIDTKEA